MWLGNLVNLTDLSLSSNQLSGTIPSELSNLVNLTRLDLDSNQLSGTIPSELGNLVNLTYLNLGDNQLSGTIPSELGNLVNLGDGTVEGLYLNNNQLSGIIPDLSNLTKLAAPDADFGYNQLTGETAGSATARDPDWADTQNGLNQSPTASFTLNPSTGDTPLTVALDATASNDPDGSITTYSWASSDGQTASGNNTNLTFNTAGTYTITLTVTDDGGLTGSLQETVVVSSTSVNNPPVLDAIAHPTSVTVGITITFIATASDPDGNNLSFSLENAPTDATIDTNSGVFTWTPSDTGVFNMTVKVMDNGNPPLSDTESLSITVNQTAPSPVVTNHAPVINDISDQTVTVGNQLQFTVTSTDQDPGDILSFSLVTAPVGAAIDSASGVFTWTPSDKGATDITIKVTDNGTPPLSHEKMVKITVNPTPTYSGGGGVITPPAEDEPIEEEVVNHSPKLDNISDQKDVLPGTTLELNISATDEDGDKLTFSLKDAPAGMTINENTGLLTWTIGDERDDFSITVVVNDNREGDERTDEETFTVTILPYNVLTTTQLPSESGSIKRDPEGMSYKPGETVTLTALPKSSCYTFTEWTGACNGNDPVCTLTMDADKDTTALFEYSPFSLNVQAEQGGTVTIKPEQEVYHCQDQITLTAKADSGYRFLKWEGDLSGNENNIPLAIQDDLEITAIFGKIATLKITPLQVLNAKIGQRLSFTASGEKDKFFWATTGGELDYTGSEATYTVSEKGVFYIWVSDGENFAWSLVDATKSLVLLSISPETLNLWTGETQAVSVKGYRADGSWIDLTQETTLKVDSTSIAQVLKEAKIKGKREGETTLFADYQDMQAEINIQVQDKTTFLKVEPELLLLHEGSSSPVTIYSVNLAGEKTLFSEAKLSILDENIASINGSKVKGLKMGATWLEVRTSDEENALPIPVVVRSRPQLDITPAIAVIELGNPVPFTVTGGQFPYEMSTDQGYVQNQDESTFIYQSNELGEALLIATDSDGEEAEAQVKIVAPLSVTPKQAVLDRGNKITIDANGGERPYEWVVTSGELKSAGKTANYTAPSRSGLHTVTVIDALGNSEAVLILVGDALSLSQQKVFLAPGEMTQIKVLGGIPPYQITATAGNALLDSEVIDNYTALINYTAPQVAGNYSVTVRDSQAHQISADINVKQEILITPVSGRVDLGESLVLQTAGGFGTPRWRTTQGQFDQQEGESVTWMAPNHYGTAFVYVSDASGLTATTTIEISSSGLAITPSVQHIYPEESTVFTVTGGSGPYTWWTAGEGDYEAMNDDKDIITYTASDVRNKYEVNVEDSMGNKAQAQVNVYTTRLLASPKRLYIPAGESLPIALSGGTGEYTLWTALGEVADNEIKLTKNEVYTNTYYTALKDYQGYDTITITDTAGNQTSIAVEISDEDQVIQHVLDDFFTGESDLSSEELYWICEEFMK
ncbi:MAG: hypothetical protein DRQ49_17345 [Gammaproteobacteria bacterium]|nr:MAG: hypothetical protein DRQ49_17345 [Gammaproteobacteria bacterium]